MTATRTPLDICADGNVDEYCRINDIDYAEFQNLLAENEPVDVPDYFLEGESGDAV